MRVSTNEFFHQAMSNLRKIKTRLLTPHLRVKDDLKQQITQLFPNVWPVLTFNGVCDFKGFFDGMRNDAGKVLLEIPGAPRLRVSETGHQVQKIIDGIRHCRNHS